MQLKGLSTSGKGIDFKEGYGKFRQWKGFEVSWFWLWNRIPSRILNILVILDQDSAPIKMGIVTPMRVLCFWPLHLLPESIFNFSVILYPDSDPVKNGIISIIKPLAGEWRNEDGELLRHLARRARVSGVAAAVNRAMVLASLQSAVSAPLKRVRHSGKKGSSSRRS